MASLCKRQQCTIDRRGFRQELDSWRHKLIHCVGFESILEGLFGPELVEDLLLFKDREPVAVSDWSFDENCIFCCLRRDKVKEHLTSLNEGLEDPPKPLLVKDQTLLIRLERQAEEFLSAVLRRKDVPNFLDPHVPVVAREILQRMIRQFAAEYTSKTSPSQDTTDSQPHTDQSLPPAQPCTSPAAPPALSAHNQNPVLSKLLMIDQDAPLDLTIKKPPAEPSEQDGVLDLSIKRNRQSSFSPVRSSCLSPITSTPKGEPREVKIANVKELQSASTLEQFMSKLCLHHQRQIIDAIGFLQAEVKAYSSSRSSQPIKSTTELQQTSCSPVKLHAASPTKLSSDLSKLFSSADVQDRPHSNSSSCPKLKTIVTIASPLDISRTSPATIQTLVPSTTTSSIEARHVDHAPLKMKIMKTGNVAAGNKLSCVLSSSLSPQAGTLEERQGNFQSSSKVHTARFSSAFKKHEPSHTHPVRQKEAFVHAEDRAANPYSFHVSISSNSPRTARKSLRPSSEHRNGDPPNRVIVDPDLGHCDIVYINKPITECFKKRHRGMVPRRNARKSTRGHMYADETWELKTVRTLAGRGNCPNPMLEFNTSVTPKQNLSKPESVPPVDMPCAGECTEADQQISLQEPAESELPEMGQAIVTAASEIGAIVETSQTDQLQVVEESVPLSPVRQVENTEMSSEQETPAEQERSVEKEDNVAQVSEEEIQISQIGIDESVKQVLSDTVSESVEESTTEKADGQASSDNMEAVEVEQNRSPPPVKERDLEESEGDKMQDEPNQDCQTETNINTGSSVEIEKSSATDQATENNIQEQDRKVEEDISVDVAEIEKDDEECNVSSKTLDSLLKELPPWRRKKGSVVTVLQKHIQKTEEVIVGFVAGRPVSASDRSLRHRSGQSLTPQKMPEKRVQKAANKTVVNSNAESRNLDKPLPEPPKQVKTDSSPSIPPPADLPDRPTSLKSTRKSKVGRKPNVDKQTAMSTRHLRSSGQIPAESPTMPLDSVTETATSSSEPVKSAPLVNESTEISTEQETCPPVASTPPPMSSPSLVQPSPQNTELSPETNEGSNIDKQQVEPTNIEPQRNEDSPAQSKPKLRSAKVVTEPSKSDKDYGSEELSTIESSIKSEPQSQLMSLRSKRTLPKEAESSKSSVHQKSIVEPQIDSSSSADDSGANSEKPTRMPRRSESNKTEPSQPVEDKRLSLRSQRQALTAARQSEVLSPVRMTKAQVKSTSTPGTSAGIACTSKSEPSKQASVKFLEALNGEEYKQLITNLNLKYDRMQKGWLQMDKEGQPTPKHKNKADRQAAIWKSKRRMRKPKSLENQKYSPVQMLFMKGFDLSSICRWFLETTETQSLVIVKKVNTRLPSETQLCFHSSSSASSLGVYPSLQAERLKKHLKKFAIASPVKSNPKSQKLIAKALEQELNMAKGKEKKDLPIAGLKRAYSSAKRVGESQKTPGKTQNKPQNPASARILRKYSNIREKMQVQHANARLRDKTKVKANLKVLPKDSRKLNLKSSLKTSSLHVRKPVRSVARVEKKTALVEKPNQQKSTKQPDKDKAVRPGKQVLKDEVKKDEVKEEVKKDLPKRTSQRLVSPPEPEPTVTDTPKNKADKKVEDKKDVEIKLNKAKAAKVQKEASDGAETKGTNNSEAQTVDSKATNSPDQVLTRAQSKMEALSSANVTPKNVSKKTPKSLRSTKAAVPAEEPALTRSGALKLSAKRSQTAMLPRSASKRAQELLETPAKRTRTK